MTQTKQLGRYDTFVSWGKTGMAKDVDRLMEALVTRDDLATSKLVDFAMSLVKTPEGIAHLKDYLFNGTQVQRNYAALYFKRKGQSDLIDRAFNLGLIDLDQAYLQ